MKQMLALFAVAIALATGFSAAAGADSNVCKTAVANFGHFIDAQENTCDYDEDCDGFYFHPDPCAPAIILPVALSKNPEFVKDLIAQQGDVRAVCAEDWKDKPACSPEPFKAVCARHKCIQQR